MQIKKPPRGGILIARTDKVIKVLLEGEEFSIPMEEYLKLKKKRERDPNFDFEKEVLKLAVKYSQGIPKLDN